MELSKNQTTASAGKFVESIETAAKRRKMQRTMEEIKKATERSEFDVENCGIASKKRIAKRVQLQISEQMQQMAANAVRAAAKRPKVAKNVQNTENLSTAGCSSNRNKMQQQQQ